MTNFFRGIETLFVDYLFAPYDFFRNLAVESWWGSNSINWLLFIIGFVAMIYWTLQLRKYDASGEEDKDITSHSFL